MKKMKFDDLDLPTLVTAFIGVIMVLLAAILYVIKKERDAKKELSSDDKIHDTAEEEEEEVLLDDIIKKPTKQDVNKKKVKDFFNHKWLATTLKGHTAPVTGISYSPDGKKLVSVSTDRTVFLWKVVDFLEKEHKMWRQFLDYDTATNVDCAADSKSILLNMKRDNKLSIFKWTTKDNTGGMKLVQVEKICFPICHQKDIKWIGIASNSKFMLSASDDRKVVLYDMKGEIITKLEPKVSTIYHCAISPDGRFISVCGFTPDVFIYEPVFKNDGGFHECKKIYNLSGHSSGVFSAAFNHNSTKAVTASKDGFWRIFDTDIRYDAGQDASVLRKGEWACLKGAIVDEIRLAFSPLGGSIAISNGTTIKFFSSEDENANFDEILEVHSSSIETLAFSPCSSYLTSCSDRYIRTFHNVPEHHSNLIRTQKSLSHISGEGPRRRAMDLVEESKRNIQKFST